MFSKAGDISESWHNETTLNVTVAADESIIGTWQSTDGNDTVIFYANGEFSGSYNGSTPTIYYNGTYTIQGNSLTITYITPVDSIVPFTLFISGDTCEVAAGEVPELETPGFELIFAICAIALVLFWKKDKGRRKERKLTKK